MRLLPERRLGGACHAPQRRRVRGVRESVQRGLELAVGKVELARGGAERGEVDGDDAV